MNGLARSPDASRQPIFNIPTVMVVLIAVLLGIHALQTWVLDINQYMWLLANFAFFPLVPELPLGEVLPGARIWSFLTYALLHGDWSHVLVNVFWMAAFGSALAWRFGARRFLFFSATAAVAGALAHLASHTGDTIPAVGASAAVSAHMAGAARFLFVSSPGVPRTYWSPAAPLSAVFRDKRTMTFLGVWLLINLAFGSISWGGNSIAWEAHIGGFAVGLLLFPLFDPVRAIPAGHQPPPPPAA